jgi:lysophospholipase L1-like esterase
MRAAVKELTLFKGVGQFAVYNNLPANLAVWRAARVAFLAGGARPKVACVGDSKTAGIGADGISPADGVGARPLSWPAKLATELTARGLPAVDNAALGLHGFGSIANLLTYDTRLTGFSGYSRNTTSSAFGLGGFPVFTSTVGAAASFQPVNVIDHFDVYTIGKSGDAVWTLTQDADPTVLATVDGNVASQLVKTTVAVNRGLTKLNFQKLSGTNGNSLYGIVGWDSVSPAVEVSNLGVASSTSANWQEATFGYGSFRALATYAPKLTILGLCTNDLGTSVAVATWSANEQALITQAKLSGDVILVFPSHGNTSSVGTDSERAAYRAQMLSLAVANGCVMVDFDQLLGGPAAAEAAGYFADHLHETAAAYAIEARALAQLLMS